MRLLMDELVIQGEKEKRFIIDFNDSLQLRYELVRELKLSGSPKEEICSKFGYRINRGNNIPVEKLKTIKMRNNVRTGKKTNL